MSNQQRYRIWTFSALVNEMNTKISDNRLITRKGIDPLLLCAPIEFCKPIICQLFHVLEIGTVTPTGLVNFIRPASSLQALVQVIQNFLRDRNFERLNLHGIPFVR